MTTADLTKESKERTLKREGEGIDACKTTKVVKAKKVKEDGAADTEKVEVEAKELTEAHTKSFMTQKEKLIAFYTKLREKCQVVVDKSGASDHTSVATEQVAEAELLC